MARIQNAQGMTSTSTLTVTLPNNPVSGHGLILLVWTLNTRPTPITVQSVPSDGASWQKATSTTETDASYYSSGAEIWYALNVSSAAGKTVTVTLSGEPSNAAFGFCAEYSELLSPDQTASSTGSSGGTVDSGTTPTTAENNELCVAILGETASNSHMFALSPTNGFTSVDHQGNDVEFCEKFVSSRGTQSTTDTVVDGGIVNYSACIATFKTGVPPPPPILHDVPGRVTVAIKTIDKYPTLAYKLYDKIWLICPTLNLDSPEYSVKQITRKIRDPYYAELELVNRRPQYWELDEEWRRITVDANTYPISRP